MRTDKRIPLHRCPSVSSVAAEPLLAVLPFAPIRVHSRVHPLPPLRVSVPPW
jgi:hypothetical protein